MVSAECSESCQLYCGVFSTGHGVDSTQEIVEQRRVSAVGTLVQLLLVDLPPAETSEILCVAASPASGGHAGAEDLAAVNRVSISTSCCKTAKVRWAASHVPAGAYQFGGLSVSLSHLPSDSLTLTAPASPLATFQPSSLNVWRNSPEREFAFDLTGEQGHLPLQLGNVSAAIELTGASAEEYTVIYGAPRLMRLTGNDTAPPAPVLRTAVFSADGSSLAVSFDAPTDRAAGAGLFLGLATFNCDLLLTFVGSAEAQCRWTDGQKIIVSPDGSGATVIVVGDAITAVPLMTRASCVAIPNTPCGEFEAATAAVEVVVEAPDSLALPLVRVQTAASIGPCKDMVLDLSSSTGSGGRQWVAAYTVSTEPVDANSTSVVAALLSAADSMVVTIPADVLRSNRTYTVGARLCNFLGACASHTVGVAVSVVIGGDVDFGTPAVSLPSERQIYTSESLLLAADAFVLTCGSGGAPVSSRANLRYQWRVKPFGQGAAPGSAAAALRSVSVDPTRFRLESFSLDPGAWYGVHVEVTDTATGKSATAASVVTVALGRLLPAISGGARQTVGADGSLRLVGCESLDEDRPRLRGDQFDYVDYSWSCVQTAPANSIGNVCPFSLVSTGCTVLVNTSGSVGFDYTTDSPLMSARMTLSMSDGVRAATASVDMDILPDRDPPLVSISVLSTVPFNTNTRLILAGVVSSSSPCAIRWSVESGVLNLTAAAETPLESLLPAQSVLTPMQLVLRAGTLSASSTYSFLLSCGPALATVSVHTNGPPTFGSFSVTPPAGTEASTMFRMAARDWFDVDVPLSFQYEMVVGEGRPVVRSRRPNSAVLVQLAAGPDDSGYNRTYSVVVFDSLDAFVTADKEVTVSPRISGFGNYSADMAALVGDKDGVHQMLTMYALFLNRPNCSLAPDTGCAALNREPCGPVQQTCGGCLAGRPSDKGAGNRRCFSQSEIDSFRNTSAPPSAFPTKPCPGNCSGHGVCVGASADTMTEGHCRTNDPSCIAICRCNTGRAGDMCEHDLSALMAARASNDALALTLAELVATEDPSAETAEGWIADLALLSTNTGYLSATAGELLLGVAEDALTAAATLQLPMSAVDSVFSAVDRAVGAVSFNSSSDRTQLGAATAVLTGSLMRRFATLALSELVPGEPFLHRAEASTFKFSSYAVETQPGLPLSITIPSSTLEAAIDSHPLSNLSIILPGDAARTLSVAVTEVPAFQYQGDDSSEDLSSNPIALYFKSGAMVDAEVQLTFQTVRPTTYALFNDTSVNNSIVTVCGNETNTTVAFCPGNIEIVTTCNGTVGTIVTPCPLKHIFPGCRASTNGDSSNNQACVVTGYTDSTVSCACTISSSGGRRRLVTGDEIESFEAAAIVVEIVGDIASTFSHSPTSGKGVLRVLSGTLVVIGLFSVVWGVGVSAILMLIFDYHFLTQATSEEVTAKKAETTAARGRRSGLTGLGLDGSGSAGMRGTAATSDLTAKMNAAAVLSQNLQLMRDYLKLLLPTVYAADIPLLSRIKEEMKRHHRYFVVFSNARSPIERGKRIIMAFKVLTIETVFLFALAVSYDLDSPADDGSCVAIPTEEECLLRTAVTDADRSYCIWTEPQSHIVSESDPAPCQYYDAEFSIKSTILVAVIVALFAAAAEFPIDFLFGLLAAPTADAVKMTKKVTTTLRRASNAILGGAASGAAALAMALSKQQQKEKFVFYNTTPTKIIDHDILQKRSQLVTVESSRGIVASRGTRTDHRRALMRGKSASVRALMGSNHSPGLDQSQSIGRGRGCMPLVPTPPPGAAPSSPIISTDNMDPALPLRAEPASSLAVQTRVESLLHDLGLQVDATSERSVEDCDKLVRVWNHAAVVSTAELDEDACLFRDAGTTADQGLIKGQAPHSRLEALAGEASLFLRRSTRHNRSPKDIAKAHGTAHRRKAEENHRLIADELANIGAAVAHKESVLEFAGDAHVGVVIMHEFIMDLLGRTTPEAKIFEEKTKADFQDVMVVSVLTKGLVLALLVLINLGCVWFTLLKSFSRGVNWQHQYLFACCIQITAEILFFETMNVLWLNVVVPQLVMDDVTRAFETILEALDRIEGEYFSRVDQGDDDVDVNVFNAADYLFISKHLAKLHPHTMESRIVNVYETVMPTPHLFQTMGPGSAAAEYSQQRRRSSSSKAAAAAVATFIPSGRQPWGRDICGSCSIAAAVVLMRLYGLLVGAILTVPLFLQDFIISVVQPLGLALVIMIIGMCNAQPLWYLLLVTVVVGLGYWALKKIDSASAEQLARLKLVEAEKEKAHADAEAQRVTKAAAEAAAEAQAKSEAELQLQLSSSDGESSLDLDGDISFHSSSVSEPDSSLSSADISSSKSSSSGSSSGVDWLALEEERAEEGRVRARARAEAQARARQESDAWREKKCTVAEAAAAEDSLDVLHAATSAGMARAEADAALEPTIPDDYRIDSESDSESDDAGDLIALDLDMDMDSDGDGLDVEDHFDAVPATEVDVSAIARRGGPGRRGVARDVGKALAGRNYAAITPRAAGTGAGMAPASRVAGRIGSDESASSDYS